MATKPTEKRERDNELEPIDPKQPASNDDMDEDKEKGDDDDVGDDDDNVEEIDLDHLDAMEGPDA